MSGKAQIIVEDIQNLLPAEQGRIQFNDGVEPLLLHEVAGDLLDLLRRATVHCGKCHVVRNLRWDFDIGKFGEPRLQHRSHLRQFRRTIPHLIQESGKARILDTFEL